MTRIAIAAVLAGLLLTGAGTTFAVGAQRSSGATLLDVVSPSPSEAPAAVCPDVDEDQDEVADVDDDCDAVDHHRQGPEQTGQHDPQGQHDQRGEHGPAGEDHHDGGQGDRD